MNKNKSRNPSFELMRTIAMIMVTMLHALGHGGVLEQYEFGSFGYIFWWFIETLSYVAVNLFVLITGYFMVNSKFKISRIIKLIIQVEFYSLMCLVIAKFVLHQQLDIEEIVRAVFPITGKIYWFASTYAALIAISPLLNKFICAIDKNYYLLVCFLLTVVFCIIPTFLFWSRETLSTGSDLIWFIVLYFIAAFIRLYGNEVSFLRYPKDKYFIAYIVLCVLGLISRLIIGKIGIVIFGKLIYEWVFYSYNSIIIFAASISLFLFFKNIEIKNKITTKSVIWTGNVCFGAYLWSDNPFMRKPLWDFVNLSQMVKSVNEGVTLVPIAVVVIFFIGCIIEFLRSSLFNVIGVSKLIKKIEIDFQLKCDKAYKYINQRII